MDPKHRDTNVNAFPMLDEMDQDRGPSPLSRALGDVVNLYDVCGRMGLCPECRQRGDTRGCQRYYVFGRVRGVPDD